MVAILGSLGEKSGLQVGSAPAMMSLWLKACLAVRPGVPQPPQPDVEIRKPPDCRGCHSLINTVDIE